MRFDRRWVKVSKIFTSIFFSEAMLLRFCEKSYVAPTAANWLENWRKKLF
jgi:hypothetical protein